MVITALHARQLLFGLDVTEPVSWDLVDDQYLEPGKDGECRIAVFQHPETLELWAMTWELVALDGPAWLDNWGPDHLFDLVQVEEFIMPVTRYRKVSDGSVFD